MKDPDFIDTVFDNRAVLWAAETRRSRAAGPFEISEVTLSEVEEQRERWRIAALLEHEEVIELTERLKESDQLIAQLGTAFASGSMVREEQP